MLLNGSFFYLKILSLHFLVNIYIYIQIFQVKGGEQIVKRT